MRPYVSIIIPSYQRGHRLLAAIDSALHQTVDNTEILVVDDGSRDGSIDLVRRLGDARIRCFELTEHTGSPGAVRNRALSEAQAPWVAFLDSDDTWLPHHLWTCLSWLERQDEAFVSTTLIREPDQEMRSPSEPSQAARTVTTRDLMLSNPIVTSAVVCRTHLINTAGRFPEGTTVYEDLALWLRISVDSNLHVLNEVTARYATSVDSYSSGSDTHAFRHGTYVDFLRWLKSQEVDAPRHHPRPFPTA